MTGKIRNPKHQLGVALYNESIHGKEVITIEQAYAVTTIQA